MRLIARILGAILLALAMILLVIDGTRSLAANALVVTALEQNWADVLPGTLETAQSFVQQSVHPLLWEPVIATLIAWPGWAVFGVAGIVLALFGRTPNRRRLVSIDQF